MLNKCLGERRGGSVRGPWGGLDSHWWHQHRYPWLPHPPVGRDLGLPMNHGAASSPALTPQPSPAPGQRASSRHLRGSDTRAHMCEHRGSGGRMSGLDSPSSSADAGRFARRSARAPRTTYPASATKWATLSARPEPPHAPTITPDSCCHGAPPRPLRGTQSAPQPWTPAEAPPHPFLPGTRDMLTLTAVRYGSDTCHQQRKR